MFTAEQRAKGQAARKAAIANSQYRKDWLDAELWALEAKKRGIRLPQWHIAPTPRKLKQWHERLNKGEFRDVYGCTPRRLMELNPLQPLRAFIGQMLETSGERSL